MTTEQFTLVIDKEQEEKLSGYCLYRSVEKQSGRPTIDGVYIQRRHLANQPPDEITITLEWQSKTIGPDAHA